MIRCNEGIRLYEYTHIRVPEFNDKMSGGTHDKIFIAFLVKDENKNIKVITVKASNNLKK